MSVNVRWTTAASRISNGRSSPILHEMRTGRSISKTEFNCSIRRRYLAAGFTLGDFAVQASWTNARRLHGALHRFNSPKIVSLDFLSGENPATKADKAPPTVPSSFLRHRVGRLCTVLDIAFHLKTGRKLRVGWRERSRLTHFIRSAAGKVDQFLFSCSRVRCSLSRQRFKFASVSCIYPAQASEFSDKEHTPNA